MSSLMPPGANPDVPARFMLVASGALLSSGDQGSQANADGERLAATTTRRAHHREIDSEAQGDL
jgi:hypothetical protein